LLLNSRPPRESPNTVNSSARWYEKPDHVIERHFENYLAAIFER
jgi:hypothetical protein